MDSAAGAPRRFEGLRYLRKWQRTISFSRVEQQAHLPGRWLTRAGALGPVRRPVFVLGSPRSGTTYLGALLAAIPGVSYFFEPPILKYYARLVYDGEVPLARARRFYAWAFRVLRFVAPGRGLRVVEKNPNHTWIAETLLAVFPDAQFVMILRDGRDATLSLLAKPWHLDESAGSGRYEPGGYPYGPYPHFYIEPDRRDEYLEVDDLTRCAWIWRRHTEEMMRLQGALPPGCWHVLRYEDLLMEPEPTLAELLTFLGADSPEARRLVAETARSGHRSSIGKWRDQLDRAAVDRVTREAGPLLRQLRYDD